MGHLSTTSFDSCNTSLLLSNCSSCLKQSACAWCLPYVSTGSSMISSPFCTSQSQIGYMNCQGRDITTATSSICHTKPINVSDITVILMTIFFTACCFSCLTSLGYCMLRSFGKSQRRVNPIEDSSLEQAEAQWVNNDLPNHPDCIEITRDYPGFIVSTESRSQTEMIIYDLTLGIENNHENSRIIQELKDSDIMLFNSNDTSFGINTTTPLPTSTQIISNYHIHQLSLNHPRNLSETDSFGNMSRLRCTNNIMIIE